MSTFSIPRPRVTKEQIKLYLKDPEIVTLEILFVCLTLSNVFVVYRILLDVCPFPITVTWFQLLTSFLYAYILGHASQEFKRCMFPKFVINLKLMEKLAFSMLIYLAMITSANMLLRATPSIATFPIIASFAVSLHHASRFIGCGQIYVPIRWLSLLIMTIGFVLAIFDSEVMGLSVLPIALIYSVTSAVFHAWCLEKCMHIVDGKGNSLHNHQVAMGLITLPVLSLFTGELGKFLSWMPSSFNVLFTYQTYGCLITAGTIPFVKNAVANRLIRRTGQAPWRALEILSMILVFLIGSFVFKFSTIIGFISFMLVLSGRILGALDALSKNPEDARKILQKEPQYNSAMPSYDPTGISNSFDNETPPAIQITLPTESLKSSSMEGDSLRGESVRGSDVYERGHPNAETAKKPLLSEDIAEM